MMKWYKRKRIYICRLLTSKTSLMPHPPPYLQREALLVARLWNLRSNGHSRIYSQVDIFVDLIRFVCALDIVSKTPIPHNVHIRCS